MPNPLDTTLIRATIKEDWAQDGYYGKAEHQAKVFWTDAFPLYAQFRQLDLDGLALLRKP